MHDGVVYDKQSIRMKKAHVRTDGFEGILFPGRGDNHRVMIVMSGSNGGMSTTRHEARFYDRNGVPSLALALFGTKETKKDLDRVPVEYIENAIKWLKQEGYQKIGVDGMSKGSEIALVSASLFDEISCIIARVPSHFVSEGLITKGTSKRPSGTSCWSYHALPLPYASYKCREFDLIQMFVQQKELHVIDFNRDKDVTSESLIPIQDIKAPILLISSKNDSVWPSYESATYIERHLKEIAYAYPVQHMACEYMSHAAVTHTSPLYRLAFKTERQHPKECREERERMKQTILDWLALWDREN